MANNKFYGYSPKTTKPSKPVEKTWGGENEGGNAHEGIGNPLDRVNPYEFRKGMDYELTAIGCSRLAESTPEEREKTTEKVLKNLEGNGGYYTSIITYETLFRNVEGSKPSFTSWLKEQDDVKMKEVKSVWKTGKMKDADHKNDKMTKIKEAIKRRIKAKLNEDKASQAAAKKDRLAKHKSMADFEKSGEEFDDFDDAPDAPKKADKAGAKVEKGMARFEDEKKAIDELLFGEATPLSDKQRAKGEKEISQQNPAEGSLLHRKNENLEVYKTDKDVDAYKNLIKLNEKEIEALEDHIETFGAGKDGKGLGNNVTLDMVKGEDLPSTIKKLEARKVSIDKEVSDETARVGEQRREIAATDLTREDQLGLLNIIKENGVSLREGSDSIRPYYEIAKRSFLEGLGKGMQL
tara:strand:- start:182 stop:1402 length:1221 start_codon:yes stop_codon:yes gene_type:complete